MRWIYRGILFALFCTVSFLLFRDYLVSGKLEKIELNIPTEVDLEISRGYVLTQSVNNQLVYVLSQSPEKLWIASTAILPSNNNKTARFPYSLNIEVRDKNDNVIYRNEFHQETSETKLVSLEGEETLYPETFLGDSEAKLSTTSSIHLSLPPGATRLIVRQNKKIPEINDILVRAYQYVQRSTRVAPLSVWERLSVKQKNQLTEYFPFDETFLSDVEKANLADYRWQPLVPIGDEGEDYLSSLIYRIPSQHIKEKRHLLSRYDHQIDVYKRVSFPIEVEGNYRLEASHQYSERPYEIFMTWHNPQDSYKRTRTFRFEQNNEAQEISLRPGMVTFTASIPLSIDLFAVSGLVEEHDHFSSAVILMPEQPIEFSLPERDDDNMPIQLQIRAFSEQRRHTAKNAVVKIELSKSGQVIKSAEMSPDFFPEEDSQIVAEEFYNWLGVAKRFFMNAPAMADTLRMESNSPVLVTLYTRLEGMPAIRVLPEEKRDWYDYPSGVPDWFSIRPNDWTKLLNTGGIKLLKHYHRSLLDEQEDPDPDESYQSLLDDFETLTLSDLIVENPFPGQPVKLEENTSLNFAPLDVAATLESEEVDGRPVTKKLFYVRDTQEIQQLQWQKNGVRQNPLWVVGKWGIIDESSVGLRFDPKMEIQSSSTSWFISGVPRELAKWQQRRGTLLQKGENITLDAVKDAPQKVISIIAYTTSQQPVELDVNMRGLRRDANNRNTHTILKRTYQLQPQMLYSGFQVAGDKQIVGRLSFSILLDEDVINGNFQLDIRQLAGDAVFLSVVTRELKPVPIVERYRTGLEH